MQTDTMIKIEPAIYTLNKKDIGELVHCLELKIIPGSPLQSIVETKEALVLSSSAEELLKDAVFTSAVRVMAAPQKLIRVYAGGGMQPRGDLFVCLHPGVNAAPLVAITPSFENTWIILVFPETVQGIAWLLETIAGNIEDAPHSPFPETFTPELLIYILGAIDQYRRCSYESMLNHVQDETFSFTLENFAGNIEKELKSGDMRWLLPSFMTLAPGFCDLDLTEDKTVYEQLSEIDMMMPVLPGEEGLRFGFGEVGKDTGTEFLRTWVKSAGIEISYITGNRMIVQNQAYLASTMLANHFFEILPATDTRNRIKYSILTRNALGELLETWATTIPEPIIPVEIKKEKEHTPAVVTEPATSEINNCTNCGKPVLPGAHFCPQCGTVLTEQKTTVNIQKFCSQCGEPIHEKNRFCSKCGKPVKA